MNVDELIDIMNDQTCLQITFEQSHADCYVYRFPSGIMVAAWDDESLNAGILRMDEDYVRAHLKASGVNDVMPVPFWTTPFEEEAVKPPNAGGCWVCERDDGKLEFDFEFDTYYHADCLGEHDTVLEYERSSR